MWVEDEFVEIWIYMEKAKGDDVDCGRWYPKIFYGPLII